ncbi:hypothetical protein [Zavarzinella formosa]|uniref:hypothetical protein n=1 Tax=Zavarzinella formosa TaxID=360055 RepID=UPI0002FB27B6|nr:hypothetical protein [Zavarzinella formosa]
MKRTVLIDELHIIIRVAEDLPEAEIDAIRLTLAGHEFTDRLRQAARAILRAFPELASCRLSVTR